MQEFNGGQSYKAVIYNGTTKTCSPFNLNKSCRGCNKNLAGNDPASIYQKQKIIQGAVRINSSLYTMNLSGLNTYQQPATNYQIVEQAGSHYVIPPNLNWNQMSDRARPSHQFVKTGSGSTYGSSSLRGTKVRNRPGAMSPGGIGVDIKHNSYERRLNRLKGKGLLKRGNNQVSDGQQMQGGKTQRPGIVTGCNCSNESDNYKNNIQEFNDVMYDINVHFTEGQTVLVRKNLYELKWYKGKIISIVHNIYTIDFGSGISEQIDVLKYEIIPYFRQNRDCLDPNISVDPTTIIAYLDGANFCAKEQLLESGIFL